MLSWCISFLSAVRVDTTRRTSPNHQRTGLSSRAPTHGCIASVIAPMARVAALPSLATTPGCASSRAIGSPWPTVSPASSSATRARPGAQLRSHAQRRRRRQRHSTPARAARGRHRDPALPRRRPRWPPKRSEREPDGREAARDGCGRRAALASSRSAGREGWAADVAGRARRPRHDRGRKPRRCISRRDERGASQVDG